MTEILLAYDSSDRERVRPVRDALAAQGFDVHWDLEPPAGVEWEKWVRKRLARCKCVVALRSTASAHSNRMSLVEALAKEHGKLIVVRLEPQRSWQGAPAAAADGLNLAGWSGDVDHPGWQELNRRIESKLKASLWVQRLMRDVEMERARWRAQYDASAARCKVLHDELARERSERGAAQDKVAGLQAQLDADARSRFRLEARIVELEQRLARAEERSAEAGELLKEEIRQKDAQLTEAQAALGAAQEEAARLRTELANVEVVHGELRSSIDGHIATIRARDARIGELDAAIDQRDAEIAGLKAVVEKRDADIAGLKNVVEQRDTEIAGLKAAVGQRDADIAGLRAAVAARDGEVAHLRAAVAAHDESVARLTAKIAERDGAVASLEAGVVARDGDIASLKADMADRDSYIAALEASVSERDSRIADLQSTIAYRNAYMAGLEASIAQRDTHIADLETTVAERDARIASLEASLAELEQRPRGLAAAVQLPAMVGRMRRSRPGVQA